MIAGFELPWQVRDQIAALERELRGHARDDRHRASIEQSLAAFKVELARMETEGVEEEHVTTNKAMGTTAHLGVPGVDRGRIV
jgi:hypothetical protein